MSQRIYLAEKCLLNYLLFTYYKGFLCSLLKTLTAKCIPSVTLCARYTSDVRPFPMGRIRLYCLGKST